MVRKNHYSFSKRICNYVRRRQAKGESKLKATMLIPFRSLQYLTHHRKPNSVTGFKIYEKPLLITYARSGTNWVRYVIEYLSQQPTPGYKILVGTQKPPKLGRPAYSKKDNYIIDRAHIATNTIHKHSSSILILRNYKECLIRHLPNEWSSSASVKEFLEETSSPLPPSEYIKNIKAFECFKGRKLLIYYEDLMQYPEKEILKLIKFLKLPAVRYDDLIKNLEKHKRKSVLGYNTYENSFTSGDVKKLNYHSSKTLNKEERMAFDKYFKKNYPALFEKYLKRYGEN